MNAGRYDLIVNGKPVRVETDGTKPLLSVLRDELALRGSRFGCGTEQCGACMVLVDGRPVNSCCYLALQTSGREVTTVEGLAGATELGALQRAFLEEGGVQCGYCTPGMLISATALLRSSPAPTDEEIRQAIAGNLCRCTGYHKIVAAVRLAAGTTA